MILHNNLIPKSLRLDERPLLVCLLYLLSSFFAQFFISNVLYAMCLVDFSWFIYVLIIRKKSHLIIKKCCTKTAILSFVLVATLILSSYFWSRWYMNAIADNKSIEYFETISKSNVYMYIFMIGIAAPVGEESLFRYLILNGFMHIFNRFTEKTKYALSILLSAIIFAVMHGTGVHMLVGLFCGLAFAIVYILTNKLSVAIIIHSFYNIGTLFFHVPLSLHVCLFLTIISFLLFLWLIRSLCFKKLQPTTE